MPGCQAVAASQSGEHDDEHIASSQDSARCDAGRFRSLENLAKALRIRLQKELAEKVATVQEAAIARADAAIALQHLSSIEDDYLYANLERAQRRRLAGRALRSQRRASRSCAACPGH